MRHSPLVWDLDYGLIPANHPVLDHLNYFITYDGDPLYEELLELCEQIARGSAGREKGKGEKPAEPPKT